MIDSIFYQTYKLYKEKVYTLHKSIHKYFTLSVYDVSEILIQMIWKIGFSDELSISQKMFSVFSCHGYVKDSQSDDVISVVICRAETYASDAVPVHHVQSCS